MMRDTTTLKPALSGRFVLRIDPGLHGSLREAARVADTSLNDYCAKKLASPDNGLNEEFTAIVRRTTSIVDASLLGVVAFGSWARGEATSTSDLDLLIVMDERVGVSRELYRRWDADPPLTWRDLPVAPHFVRLPPPSDPISGLWAEVAQDGLVLHDRRWVVSQHLVAVRRRILDGEVERRIAGGETYWVQSDA